MDIRRPPSDGCPLISARPRREAWACASSLTARWLGAAVTLACLGAVVVGAGCGSSDDTSTSPADASADAADADAEGQCPATLALTVGAACTVEGLQCSPEYTCDLVQVPLLCTCASGSFACVDATGASVDAAEAPACPPSGDASCPVAEPVANVALCGEVGLVCEYASACGTGVDSCECVPGSVINAGPSQVFQCQPAACAPPADAGGAEAGPDAYVPGTAEGGVADALADTASETGADSAVADSAGGADAELETDTGADATEASPEAGPDSGAFAEVDSESPQADATSE